MTFEIAFTGQARINVEALGIQVQSLVLNNLQADTVTLRILTTHDAAPMIAAGDMVDLWKDDVKIFRGTARMPSLVSSPGADFQTIVVMGPLWPLANSFYFKQAGILNVDNPLPPTFAKCWEFLQYWAATYAAGVVTMPAYDDTPMAAGSLIYFKTTVGILNQPFTTNLAALMIHYPKAAVTFDYTTTPPTMVIKLNEEAVSYAHGVSPLVGRDLAQNDALPEAVVIRERFEWVLVPEISGTVRDMLGLFTKSNIYDVYPVGHSGVGPNVVTLVYGQTIGQLPAGAAQYIFNKLNDSFWQGTIELADNAENTITPGSRINITGSYAPLATMNAVVQTVTKDYLRGRTVLQVGVSDRLTGDTAMERLVTWLRYNPSSYGVPLLFSLTDPEE